MKVTLTLRRDELKVLAQLVGMAVRAYELPELRESPALWVMVLEVWSLHAKLMAKYQGLGWSGKAECRFSLPLSVALSFVVLADQGLWAAFGDDSYEANVIRRIVNTVDQQYLT